MSQQTNSLGSSPLGAEHQDGGGNPLFVATPRRAMGSTLVAVVGAERMLRIVLDELGALTGRTIDPSVTFIQQPRQDAGQRSEPEVGVLHATPTSGRSAGPRCQVVVLPGQTVRATPAPAISLAQSGHGWQVMCRRMNRYRATRR